MFELAAECNGDRVLIFDRAHLGEFVYSPIYRNYDGSYVFDLEKELLGVDWAKCSLFLFTDDVNEIIKRDKKRGDGQSFTLDPEKKTIEVDAFNQAFELSSLRKHKVELKGRNPDDLFEQEIKPYLTGVKRMSSDDNATESEELKEEEKPKVVKKTTTKKTQTKSTGGKK